jgi:hypothetical protein
LLGAALEGGRAISIRGSLFVSEKVQQQADKIQNNVQKLHPVERLAGSLALTVFCARIAVIVHKFTPFKREDLQPKRLGTLGCALLGLREILLSSDFHETRPSRDHPSIPNNITTCKYI